MVKEIEDYILDDTNNSRMYGALAEDEILPATSTYLKATDA